MENRLSMKEGMDQETVMLRRMRQRVWTAGMTGGAYGGRWLR
jgi:hypothetical protein